MRAAGGAGRRSPARWRSRPSRASPASRPRSFPANLGALEASSLAAVTAVGAAARRAARAGAPAARAVLGRLGLAIYPRGRRPRCERPSARVADGPDAARTDPAATSRRTRPSRVSPFERLAGLPIAERVLRSAFRAGYARVCVSADGAIASRHPPAGARHSRRHPHRRPIRATGRPLIESLPANAAPDRDRRRDGRVAGAAGGRRATSARTRRRRHATSPPGREWPVSGVLRVTTIEDARHRRPGRASCARDSRRAARCPPARTSRSGAAGWRCASAIDADLAAAERTIRRSSYKDTDNKLARFNRSMSLPISVALIRTPLTANQLSVALVASGSIRRGCSAPGTTWPACSAAFLSLAASVLDGCDGEIARLKYQESALGCWIETFGDYSYYIAIFIGLTIGAVQAHRLARLLLARRASRWPARWSRSRC